MNDPNLPGIIAYGQVARKATEGEMSIEAARHVREMNTEQLQRCYLTATVLARLADSELATRQGGTIQ